MFARYSFLKGYRTKIKLMTSKNQKSRDISKEYRIPYQRKRRVKSYKDVYRRLNQVLVRKRK